MVSLHSVRSPKTAVYRCGDITVEQVRENSCIHGILSQVTKLEEFKLMMKQTVGLILLLELFGTYDNFEQKRWTPGSNFWNQGTFSWQSIFWI